MDRVWEWAEPGSSRVTEVKAVEPVRLGYAKRSQQDASHQRQQCNVQAETETDAEDHGEGKHWRTCQ